MYFNKIRYDEDEKIMAGVAGVPVGSLHGGIHGMQRQ